MSMVARFETACINRVLDRDSASALA